MELGFMGKALSILALGTVMGACGGLTDDDGAPCSSPPAQKDPRRVERTEDAGASCEAEPACQASDMLVVGDECSTFECYSVTTCGQTIQCRRAAACAAYPSCGADEFEVAECAPGGTTCHEVTVCGSTIACDSVCAGACGAGEKAVFSESACAQDDGICRQTTACGRTVWCTNA